MLAGLSLSAVLGMAVLAGGMYAMIPAKPASAAELRWEDLNQAEREALLKTASAADPAEVARREAALRALGGEGRGDQLVRLAQGMRADLVARRRLAPCSGKFVGAPGGEAICLPYLTASIPGQASTWNWEEVYPISKGTPQGGKLLNGIPMRDDPTDPWTVRRHNAANRWGTLNTVSTLVAAYRATALKYPGRLKPEVWDLSDRDGGQLKSHVSHQSGRDVDLGYFKRMAAPGLRKPAAQPWCEKTKAVWTGASSMCVGSAAGSFDIERQWEFSANLLASGKVEAMWVDADRYRCLKAYAQACEETAALVSEAFGDRSVRGAFGTGEEGHGSHVHVRFRCDEADTACASSSSADRTKGLVIDRDAEEGSGAAELHACVEGYEARGVALEVGAWCCEESSRSEPEWPSQCEGSGGQP
jgi:penicillin-insensitive murein endopeptidase